MPHMANNFKSVCKSLIRILYCVSKGDVCIILYIEVCPYNIYYIITDDTGELKKLYWNVRKLNEVIC